MYQLSAAEARQLMIFFSHLHRPPPGRLVFSEPPVSRLQQDVLHMPLIIDTKWRIQGNPAMDPPSPPQIGIATLCPRGHSRVTACNYHISTVQHVKILSNIWTYTAEPFIAPCPNFTPDDG